MPAESEGPAAGSPAPVVVDASAVAALLFGEPRGEQVAGRLGSAPLYAPTLLRYELASVCVKKGRLEPALAETLAAGLGLFSRLRLEEVQVPPGEAAELAGETGLTAYDASYLWLARQLDLELVTLDEALERAAPAL